LKNIDQPTDKLKENGIKNDGDIDII